MRKFLTCVVAVIALGSATANADPITISAGESRIFNFDFFAAGAVPAPTYNAIDIFFSGNFGTSVVDFSWYDELNGVNLVGSLCCRTNVPGFGFGFGNVPSTLPIRDGIFSFVVAVTGSALTLDSVTAVGTSSTSGKTGVIDAVTTTVPEPGTLALLGAALVGVGFARRRK